MKQYPLAFKSFGNYKQSNFFTISIIVEELEKNILVDVVFFKFKKLIGNEAQTINMSGNITTLFELVTAIDELIAISNMKPKESFITGYEYIVNSSNSNLTKSFNNGLKKITFGYTPKNGKNKATFFLNVTLNNLKLSFGFNKYEIRALKQVIEQLASNTLKEYSKMYRALTMKGKNND